MSGIKGKLPRLNDDLSRSTLSAICIQETWLNFKINDEELIKNSNYKIFRHDRESTKHPLVEGGGTLVLIKNEFNTVELIVPNIHIIQYNLINVKLPKESIILLNVYIPYGYVAQSIREFETILRFIANIKYDTIVVTGDFNLPDLRWASDDDLPGTFIPITTDSLDFYEIYTSLDLKQLLPQPLERNHLDLCLTNDVLKIFAFEPLVEDLLDRNSLYHSAVLINVSLETDVMEQELCLNFGKTRFNDAKKLLDKTVFLKISEQDVFDEIWNLTNSVTNKINSNIELIKYVQDKNTPMKKVSTNWSNKHPWLKNSKVYSSALLSKKKLMIAFLKDPSIENRDAYKAATKNVFKIFEDTRKAFMNNVLDETSANTHEFYSLMKTGSKRRNNTPTDMIYKGEFVNGEKKLSLLAHQLGNSFLKNIKTIGTNSVEIDNNLQKIYQENYTDEYQHLWTNFSLKTSLSEVSRYIDELKINKDPGPMGITSNFLKFNKECLAPIITDSINSIFETGNIPDSWKECYITPIPKKGSISDIENYRGIALQSCIPKIFDRIITRMLQDNLSSIISTTQHGFLKGKSTITNLLNMSQILHENIGANQVDVIYFDFSKAFDCVKHDLLAAKLCRYSIPYAFLRILIKFTVGRTYFLKVDNIPTMHKINPLSSVPQGSHFGPFCFIIFTNDINIDNSLKYADDTKIYRVIRNMDDRNLLQNDIRRLIIWAEENFLKLNTNKTFHVSYGRRIETMYYMDGIEINLVESTRDLGIIFDSKLLFKDHIESLARRMTQMVGAANRLVKSIKFPMLITRIFKIYIQPIMEYGSIIWNTNTVGLNNLLHLIVKRVTRIALGVTYYTNTANYIAFEKRCDILNMDPPHTRRMSQAAIMGIKIIKDEVFTYINDEIKRHVLQNVRRNNRIFAAISPNIPNKSPAHIILRALKHYEGVIDLGKTSNTIKARIKSTNKEDRERIANNTQARRFTTIMANRGRNNF